MLPVSEDLAIYALLLHSIMMLSFAGLGLDWDRLVAHQDGILERGISLSLPDDPAQVRPSAVKELSRRQLKDLLADVYASKARADRRWAGLLYLFAQAGFLIITA